MKRSSIYALTMLVCLLLALTAASHAATYYVSTAGDDASNGRSKAAAWKTINYAAQKAQAGDTVIILAGNYGGERVKIENKFGAPDKPIVLEGRGEVVLEEPERVRDNASCGFNILNSKYITIKNIELTQQFTGVNIEKSSFIALDGVNVTDCGWTRWEGEGIVLTSSDHCTLKNCTVYNAGGNLFHLLFADDCVLDGCKAIGTLKGDDPFASDYYFVISWSNRNIIKNCYAEDTTYTGKGNHGIGIKDTQVGTQRALRHGPSHDNRFINCTARGHEECIYVAWNAFNNTFENCVGDASKKEYFFSNGIMVRDGAHDNLFKNCTAIGGQEALCIYDNEMVVQNRSGKKVPQANNKFVGCTFETKPRPGAGGSIALKRDTTDILNAKNATSEEPELRLAMFLRNAVNTTFENCTFKNCDRLVRFGKDVDDKDKNSGTKFVGCKFTNIQGLVDMRTLKYPWAYRLITQENPNENAAGYDATAGLAFERCVFKKNGFAELGRKESALQENAIHQRRLVLIQP
ncbi:right-handed parallel beta-helix repeat-containing protein [bacterium]|nr:right-handed parallel beta-helix repeat-containing protein [bacterium]